MKKPSPSNTVTMRLGPNESEILKEIESIRHRHEDNSEVLSRGLHASRYLLEVDEKVIGEILISYLKRAEQKQKLKSKEDLYVAKNISFLIYAVMISKYGVLRAGLFESLPMNLKMFEQLLNKEPMVTRAKKRVGLPRSNTEDNIRRAIREELSAPRIDIVRE